MDTRGGHLALHDACNPSSLKFFIERFFGGGERGDDIGRMRTALAAVYATVDFTDGPGHPGAV
jgi:hypothetical protein